jgi:uncharacterized OB-fold protein
MAFRLAPSMTSDTQFFWDGVKAHQLLIQRCTSCGALRHPPRPMCPQCRSLAWETIESAGRGTVYSCVIPHHPPSPGFEGPYVVALVDLDEGTRIVTNIVGVAPDAVTVGMRVQVHYEAFDNDVVLPHFVPEEDR